MCSYLSLLVIYLNFLGKPLARRERDLHWHGEELKCTSPVLATANININLLIVKYKSFPFPGRYHFNNSFTAFPQKKDTHFHHHSFKFLTETRRTDQKYIPVKWGRSDLSDGSAGVLVALTKSLR